MSNIDKQRIAAVRKLEALGYSYQDGEWVPASVPSAAAALHRPRVDRPDIHARVLASDVMHITLVQRADALEGCTEGSEEEAEPKVIVDAIEVYEAVRWPDGKIPGGKG